MTESTTRLVDEVAASDAARRKLAQLIAQEMSGTSGKSRWQRTRPFFAGLASGAVVLLAFLLPSLQEQWERHEINTAVERYAGVARSLMQSAHYASAEQTFGRALELAGTKRLDLLEGQLKARVMRIYDTPQWRATDDEDITEGDFVYLLEVETATEHVRDRASTLAAYGAYLAGLNRLDDAERAFKESIQLDSTAEEPHIHLGNLYDDLNKTAAAEAEYRRAIELNPREPNARYNLGLLLAATARTELAEFELRQSVALEPNDSAARLALIEVLESRGKRADAIEQTESAIRIDPDNAELKAALARLTLLRPTAKPAARLK